jgi:hypothetical protein
MKLTKVIVLPFYIVYSIICMLFYIIPYIFINFKKFRDYRGIIDFEGFADDIINVHRMLLQYMDKFYFILFVILIILYFAK